MFNPKLLIHDYSDDFYLIQYYIVKFKYQNMRSIITFLILSISLITVGQNKIEGIGKFKLKKTTIKYIDTLCIEKNFERQPIRTIREYFNSKHKINLIVEVFPDTVKFEVSPLSIPNSHFCKVTRVFFIPRITISGIEVSGTFLTFYNDTLVEILSDYSNEVVDAFELKYGKPEIDKKEKEENCIDKETGTTKSTISTTYYQRWNNNDIKCSAILEDYYDDNCEKTNFGLITISCLRFQEKIYDCDNQEKERIRKNQDVLKKKKLNDF